MHNNTTPVRVRSTTILTVRKGATVAMGGDGQVSLGPVSYTHLTLPTILLV